ncbi:MAG: hypothetical protein UY13_C0002G0387 [Candidatus Pacebacteria bacterium GW2011_GWB1_47_8]|nr:MAG: hypothetical protein UX28_C0001G0534 [Candidatus Pacebacteria bacterium GW2011_GWA1_46_10]KKU84475.1 MAG: hypothetical protein UY13_C0002G0387 [Candidatus Pacebacteria bacterium GW2011_GWB1_47_8]HCR81093.1 hypothetical protein [Candidatus Paceibacterota bacterium]
MTEETTVRTNENLVAQTLNEQPILLPESPFWQILRDFGRDELVALGINTAGVFALSMVSDNSVFISLVGPVLEKIGFFTASSKKAFDVYRTTPPVERKKKNEYVTDALRTGFPNFLKDLVAADPLYMGLLLLELKQFPETPAWMLSVIAFMISVGGVSAAEVSLKEALYKMQTHRLMRRGFSLEKQLESRFIVKEINSEHILAELADYFQLGEIHTGTYHDIYFQPSLKYYNGRQPQLRLRKRFENGEAVGPEEIQLIYNRASELKRRKPEQYNYFPVARDKFQRVLDDESRQYLQEMTLSSEKQEVTVTRAYAHIPKKMLISTDQVENGQNPYTVIEVKSFRTEKDAVSQMIMAMRHIMSHYHVIQTTHSKQSLMNIRQW